MEKAVSVANEWSVARSCACSRSKYYIICHTATKTLEMLQHANGIEAVSRVSGIHTSRGAKCF